MPVAWLLIIQSYAHKINKYIIHGRMRYQNKQKSALFLHNLNLFCKTKYYILATLSSKMKKKKQKNIATTTKSMQTKKLHSDA